MIAPLDLQRLAVRIESLLQVHTHGWYGGDDLEFKNRLPSGRDPRHLPTPEALREMAKKGESPEIRAYQVWLASVRHLEDLVRNNDPHNPQKIMRDMARGRFPGFR
jgi:hypothetical protein